jgi:hypothetical protein
MNRPPLRDPETTVTIVVCLLIFLLAMGALVFMGMG